MSPAPAHSVTNLAARTPTGGAGMPDRHTASTITDDALDALYERLRKAERAAVLLAGSHRRAEQAEASVKRLQDRVELLDKALADDSINYALADAIQRAEEAEAELGRLRAQQAGFFAQMAAAREQARHRWQRMQQAERAIERVEALAAQWETALPGQPHHGFAEVLRAALEGQQQEVAP